MNRQTYDKIIDLINKNRTMSKHELFEFTQSKLNILDYAITWDTFASIYGTLKRRQIFKSNDQVLNWKKLKRQFAQFVHEIQRKRTVA